MSPEKDRDFKDAVDRMSVSLREFAEAAQQAMEPFRALMAQHPELLQVAQQGRSDRLGEYTMRELLAELRTRAELNAGRKGSGWLADRVDDTVATFTEAELDARRDWF